MLKPRAIFSAPFRLMAAGLVLVFCVGISLGVSYARYQRQTPAEVVIQPVTESLSVTATPWQAEGDTYSTTFSVHNGGGEARDCSVQLLASLGLKSSDRIQLQLVLGDQVYQATAEPIPQGSALYGSFGPGWIYSFTDGGNELSHTLPTGGDWSGRLVITPAGVIDNSVLFQILVHGEQ